MLDPDQFQAFVQGEVDRLFPNKGPQANAYSWMGAQTLILGIELGAKWVENQLKGITPLPKDLQQKVDIIHKAMEGTV